MIVMLKVGFVDDENTNYNDYAKRLSRRNIALTLYEGDNSVSGIVDWILDENLMCILVDYDLKKKFVKNGTDLVFEINQILPDFPCIMLTNYPEQSKNEKLVSGWLIWDREKMNSGDLSEVIDTINNEVSVYQKRKNALYEQYSLLLNKRKNSSLSLSEEERFLQLHTLFSRYGETDDLPAQILSSETNAKLDNLIERLSQLIDKKD